MLWTNHASDFPLFNNTCYRGDNVYLCTPRPTSQIRFRCSTVAKLIWKSPFEPIFKNVAQSKKKVTTLTRCNLWFWIVIIRKLSVYVNVDLSWFISNFRKRSHMSRLCYKYAECCAMYCFSCVAEHHITNVQIKWVISEWNVQYPRGTYKIRATHNIGKTNKINYVIKLNKFLIIKKL